MTTPVFTWHSDMGATCQNKPRVTSVKFGDGYEMRAADGLNSNVATWTVTFTGAVAQSLEIDAFLTERGGISKFQWTDPLGTTKNYVAREWQLNRKSFGTCEISTKFEQVFEL